MIVLFAFDFRSHLRRRDQAALERAGADWQMNVYGGAKHSFTNPGATEVGKKFNLPLEYDEKADKRSWKAMKKFLKNAFK